MKFLKKADNNMENLLLEFPSGSRYAESYRTLRTNLNFSSMEKTLSSVLVTSSVESEGKTNTAVNLGYTIAQSGSKVLLVDADLRKPRMTNVFSLKNKMGFTDIVSSTFSDPILEGDLEDYSIGDLLQLIKLQKRTGELNLQSSDNKIAIYFIAGKIIDIYWRNRPESKKIANTLVQKKILTKKEACLALGHQKKSAQRLGSILFSMGLVPKEKLSKELAVQTIESMRILSVMIEGKFHFNSLSQNEIKSPISQGVNFEKLSREFLSQGEEYLFINRAINSVIYPTSADNLYVLPSGRIPHNPSEVIGSNGSELLMELLKKRFDFIILDTPPVMPATDAMLMAPRTDGTILVVKSSHAERKIVKGVVDRFKSANLPLLGVILNVVDLKREGYYKYHEKYCSSYYGEI